MIKWSEAETGDAALALLAPVGLLMGCETEEECLADGDIRAYLGATLAKCARVSERIAAPRGNVPLWEQENCAERYARYFLPLLRENPAPGLVFSLCALTMLYAGARKTEDGYAGSARLPCEREEALRAFSRLSCDMAPDSLAYAMLSDEEIWGEDLRNIPGLPERAEEIFRDMQLLGAREAMRRAISRE